ncbi:MAG: hypothetical protein ACTSUV_02150 [Candidatus Ranarchaeia archaeon]
MGKKRPLGITILAIIVGIVALFQTLGAGIAVLTTIFIILALPLAGLIAAIVSIVLLIIGVFGLYLASGLWKLKPWSWKWSVFWTILVLVMNIISGNILLAIIGLVLMIYLFGVKDKF